MAGKAKPLTPQQNAALDEVRAKRLRFRDARAEIERRVRLEIEKEVSTAETALALAVRRAFELKIPKRRIGIDGMDTSDAGTVNDWLAKTDALAAALKPDVDPPFERNPDGTVTIALRAFPTTAQADDYPEILRGIVREHRGGWQVVSDPGTVVDEVSGKELPGWLTWEVGLGKRGPLAAMLAEWIAS